MFHLGALQQKADLQYFFSSCAFGMNIFYCYAAPVPGAGGGGGTSPPDHEVVLGWKGSVSFLHATGQAVESAISSPRPRPLNTFLLQLLGRGNLGPFRDCLVWWRAGGNIYDT